VFFRGPAGVPDVLRGAASGPQKAARGGGAAVLGRAAASGIAERRFVLRPCGDTARRPNNETLKRSAASPASTSRWPGRKEGR